jgi:molybdenum cofactor biosynthesis enzyme MoaA
MNMTYIPINNHAEILPEHSQYEIVYIDIVHRCNMECNNCYLPNREYPDVDIDKLKNFINRFSKRTEFRLIGGEPTLHKDLLDLICFISKHPLRHVLVLVTNGLKLASKKFVSQLQANGLKRVYLSMNGFDDDDAYKAIDDMPCAELKMAALRNSIQAKFVISIGFIVVKGVNDHVIDRLRDYFNTNRYRVNIEFRNIGAIGRSMKVDNYSFIELEQLIKARFEFGDSDLLENDVYSRLYSAGRFRIRLNDWTELPKGFNKTTNEIRGRMTESFKVAPFLDHIVANEGGY